MKKLLKKSYREFIRGLSKLTLKSVSLSYRGYKLKAPIVHGMLNGGYHIECDDFLFDALNQSLDKKKNGIILDVGSNMGLLLTQLKAFNQTTRYIGIDPNVGNVFFCRELIENNDFENAEVFPVGFGDEQGIKKFQLRKTRKNDPEGCITKDHNFQDNEMIYRNVMVEKGDDFLQRLDVDDIAFLKIDVEGFEENVLKGLHHYITKSLPYIFLETEGNIGFVCDLIEKSGYVATDHHGNVIELDVWKSGVKFGNYWLTPPLSQ